MKIGILNDFTTQQYLGGTELFCERFVKNAPKHEVDAVLITPANFDKEIHGCDRILATNISKFTPGMIEIIKTKGYYKLEMDYGFCRTRNALCQSCELHKANKCTFNLEGYRELLENAKKIIFLNPFQREFYKRDFGKLVNNSFCILCFMGDLDKFKDLGQEREPDSFLYAGRFYFEKGIDNVLETAMQNPRGKFYFIGWGDPKYIQMISNLRNCCYLGKKDNEDMPEMYNKFQHFISLPNWFDTGAITLVEAQLCGMKIISNDNNKVMSHNWGDANQARELILQSEKKLFDTLKGGD